MICKYFSEIWGCTKVTDISLSAYQIMPGTENLPHGLTPTVFVKVVWLEDNIANYKLRKKNEIKKTN